MYNKCNKYKYKYKYKYKSNVQYQSCFNLTFSLPRIELVILTP